MFVFLAGHLQPHMSFTACHYIPVLTIRKHCNFNQSKTVDSKLFSFWPTKSKFKRHVTHTLGSDKNWYNGSAININSQYTVQYILPLSVQVLFFYSIYKVQISSCYFYYIHHFLWRMSRPHTLHVCDPNFGNYWYKTYLYVMHSLVMWIDKMTVLLQTEGLFQSLCVCVCVPQKSLCQN